MLTKAPAPGQRHGGDASAARTGDRSYLHYTCVFSEITFRVFVTERCRSDAPQVCLATPNSHATNVRCARVRSGFVSVRVRATVVVGAAGISMTIMVKCILCVSHRSCAVSIGPADGLVREIRVLCGTGVARSPSGSGGARGRYVFAARAGAARIARASAIPVSLVNRLFLYTPHTDYYTDHTSTFFTKKRRGTREAASAA